jgi:hypothetical protein
LPVLMRAKPSERILADSARSQSAVTKLSVYLSRFSAIDLAFEVARQTSALLSCINFRLVQIRV